VNVDKLDEHITLEECRKAIYKDKNKKAVGIDCLPNEIFKKNYIDHSVNVDKLDEHITLEECRKAIYKDKNKKAVGIDCLPNEILKKKYINY